MYATCYKRSVLHVDAASVYSGTSNSGFGVDRTDKFIVLDGRNTLEKLSVCLVVFVRRMSCWIMAIH
jgi:hypothetical protein